MIYALGPARVADKLVGHLMHSIKIVHKIVEESKIKVGSSKIGGCPDLPSDIEWPQNNVDEYLAFLAQFNLGEVAPYDFKGALPSKGMLYFFYDVESAAWGFDPADAGRWKVLFYQGDGVFRSMPHPEGIPEESIFTPCVPRFFDEITVPPWDSLIIEEMGLTKKKQDIYFDLTEKISELNGNSGTVNRLLGHPDQVQGECSWNVSWLPRVSTVGILPVVMFQDLPIIKKMLEIGGSFFN